MLYATYLDHNGDVLPVDGMRAAAMIEHAECWEMVDDDTTYSCAECGNDLPQGYVHMSGCKQYLAIYPE